MKSTNYIVEFEFQINICFIDLFASYENNCWNYSMYNWFLVYVDNEATKLTGFYTLSWK